MAPLSIHLWPLLPILTNSRLCKRSVHPSKRSLSSAFRLKCTGRYVTPKETFENYVADDNSLRNEYYWMLLTIYIIVFVRFALLIGCANNLIIRK